MGPKNPQSQHGTPNGDLELVTAVQAGDTGAFDLLVGRHLDALHAFIALKLPVPHVIDELTHETFVFAFHHIAGFAAGTDFRAWLRAIAANKIRAEVERFHRAERNRQAYAGQHTPEDTLGSLESPPTRELEALEDCLRGLPDLLRRLLHLKYHDEESSGQIAQQLRRSLAWVHTALYRTRQQLRACLESKLGSRPSTS